MNTTLRRIAFGFALVLTAGPSLAQAPEITAGHDTLDVTLSDGGTGTIHHFEYVAEGADPATRPVTFVWNGGPGAASIYMHLLAVGPEIIVVPGDGAMPEARAGTEPNPHAWTAFTDLVFYDPVGTGQSRAEGDPSAFWTWEGDMEALGLFVQAWLTENNRWASPKAIAGESYGGQRVIEMAGRLLLDHDVALDKAILVSPANGDDLGDVDSRHDVLAPALLLPTYAATAAALGLSDLEIAAADQRQAALEEVEAFALGGFMQGLARTGRMTDAELTAFYDEVAAMIGLDPELVRLHRARIPVDVFAKEIAREAGEVVDRYDMSRRYPDPLPDVDAPNENMDPSLQTLGGLIAPGAFAYLQETFDLDLTERYRMLSWPAAYGWDRTPPRPGRFADLGVAMTLNPDLDVLVAHGLYDGSTPYFVSRYLLEQSVLGEDARDRAFFGLYPGGHMFYLYEDSRAEFFEDVRNFMAR